MSSQLNAQDSESSAPSFFSSFVSFIMPTAHAEEKSNDESESEEKEESNEGEQESGEGEAEAEEADEEEEEEEEPEDPAPAIRQECEKSECAEPAKHFKHCSEKVEGGKGWHGEDCVEELFHLMHCVDACAAPKLFKKLV